MYKLVKERILSNFNELTKMKLFVIKHNIKTITKIKPKKFNGFLKYDCKELQDRYITNEYKLSNDFYGIATSLKKFSGHKKRLHLFIEHGVYFGNYINREEIEGIMPGVITFSDVRKKHIKSKSDINVVCLGPYIQYATSFYSKEEVKKIKKRFGKILLAFPQHTIEGIGIEENEEKFINEVRKIKESERFDTVMVCLYYREATSKYLKLYEDNNFIPICAGNRQDPDFLPRLKSFIEISDLTISNNVGTHIGYCYALKKKHILIDTDSKLVAKDNKSIKNVPELYLDLAVKEKNEIKEAFSTNNEKKINKVIEKYWGTNYKYTREELKCVLDTFDNIYKICKKRNKSYRESLDEILSKNEYIKEIFERKNII